MSDNEASKKLFKFFGWVFLFFLSLPVMFYYIPMFHCEMIISGLVSDEVMYECIKASPISMYILHFAAIVGCIVGYASFILGYIVRNR